VGLQVTPKQIQPKALEFLVFSALFEFFIVSASLVIPLLPDAIPNVWI